MEKSDTGATTVAKTSLNEAYEKLGPELHEKCLNYLKEFPTIIESKPIVPTPDTLCIDMLDAVSFFQWVKTNEGTEFWLNIAKKFDNNEKR